MKITRMMLTFLLLTPVGTLLVSCGDSKPHEHEYAKTYSYNQTEHWYQATCGHDDEYSGKESHSFSEWATTIEPTEETVGSKERACLKCGYKESLEVPKLAPHEHTYETTYSYDELSHWYKSSCGHEDVISMKELHTFGQWTLSNSDSGLKETRTCSVCGYKESKDVTTIKFGRYPQKKVDASTISGLSTITFNSSTWTDYGFYSDGEVASYMYYLDVDLDSDGLMDYRGIYFTSYEAIEWTLLKLENGKAMLVANLILDSMEYQYFSDSKEVEGNTVYATNYELSHIRNFLNDSFYNTAFTTFEKAKILTTTVDNSSASTSEDDNEYCCNNTNDKVFLLSRLEANTLFRTNVERVTTGTDYAKALGLYVGVGSDYEGKSTYWLRSPDSYYDNYAFAASITGNVDSDFVTKSHFGVRPALWINLA